MAIEQSQSADEDLVINLKASGQLTNLRSDHSGNCCFQGQELTLNLIIGCINIDTDLRK